MTVSQGIDAAKLGSSECEKLQSENATLQTYPRNFDMMILDIRIFCMEAELQRVYEDADDPLIRFMCDGFAAHSLHATGACSIQSLVEWRWPGPCTFSRKS